MTIETARSRFGHWRLSTQLVLTVAMTVTIVLAAFATLTAFQLKMGAERQKEAVGKLAKERFIAQLQIEAKLASSLLERSLHNVDAAVAELAGRNETRAVVKRGNIVSIDLLMQKAVSTGPLDAVLVLDSKRKAVGSHYPGLDLLAANLGIASSSFGKEVSQLLVDQDPDSPTTLRSYRAVDEDFMRKMGIEKQAGALLLTAIHPVFDDFGDVVALIIGYRGVTSTDELLHRFTKVRGLAIEMRDHSKVLFRSGITQERKGESNELSHCDQFAIRWQFCILTSQSKLRHQIDSLVRFVDNERSTLTRWLVVAALLSLLIATGLVCIITSRVLAPLAQITRAVRSVAAGNWLAGVAGQKRRDEVGEIARAVVVLQRSVKEREKLQANVADVEQVRQHRESIASCMGSCRFQLRQKLCALSDRMERLEDSVHRLIDLVSTVEGQVDEAHLVTARAFRSSSFEAPAVVEDQSILASFDRLNATVAATSHTGRMIVEELGRLTHEAGSLDHIIKSFIGDIADIPELSRSVSAEFVALQPALQAKTH